MSDEQPKRNWIGTFLTPQTLVYLLGGMVALVVFWIRTEESWAKAAKVETELQNKADKSEVKTVDDKLTRQWGIQSVQDEKQAKEIEEALDYIEWEKGYNQAKKDFNIK